MGDPGPASQRHKSHKPRYCYSYLTLSFRKLQMSDQNPVPPDFAHLKRLIYPFLVIVCLDCALHKYSKCTKVYHCIPCTSVHMFGIQSAVSWIQGGRSTDTIRYHFQEGPSDHGGCVSHWRWPCPPSSPQAPKSHLSNLSALCLWFWSTFTCDQYSSLDFFVSLR